MERSRLRCIDKKNPKHVQMFFVFILALASGLHREDAGRSNL